jgi:formylglycine-generating enzyme required for sulfatase activity
LTWTRSKRHPKDIGPYRYSQNEQKDTEMNIARTLSMFSMAVGIGLTTTVQAADARKSWVETEAAAQAAPYLVIDLTPRQIPTAKLTDPTDPPQTILGFAVTNLLAIPPGGWTDEYKTTKLVLRRIPAGTFKMGSPPDELGRDADEVQHSVTFTKDFYIGVFEVTLKQWERVTGKALPGHTQRTTSAGTSKNEQNTPELNCRPVELITYYDLRENPVTDPETARAILAKQPPPPEPKKATTKDKETTQKKSAGNPLDEGMDEWTSADPTATQDEEQQEARRSAEARLQAIMGQSSDDPGVDWPANSTVNPNSFFGKLRARTMLDGLDLPTEAQWEYACRAGTTTPLNSGKSLTQWIRCPNVAELGRYLDNQDPSEWFYSNGRNRLFSSVVGSYAPNPWGLYDMHGNVWEWCLDWYAPLPADPATDPKGPAAGTTRVIRGGGWDDRAKACRSANRGPNGNPDTKSAFFGFRVALTLP